jgi:hypothetical protein
MRKVTIGFLLLLLLGAVVFIRQGNNAVVQLKPLVSQAQAAAAQLFNQADAAVTNGNNIASNPITGKPTIAAAFINQVLAFYHSPARDLGASLYSLGVQYNINPVYALAFFLHESRLGTLGVARATLSLGNIRCSVGYTCIEGYRAYSSWASGFADWYRLMRGVYVNQWHLTTVEQIVPTYAPSGDGNNVAGYITAVEQAVSTWQAGKVEVY